MRVVEQVEAMQPFLKDADHVDVKTVEGTATLRAFVAAMLSYQPGWVTALYGVRAVFVRFLGMRQPGIPTPPPLRPENAPMTPGQAAYFFQVALAKEDEYWLAQIKDQHLDAALGVLVEPLEGQRRRFHVVTIVHYHNWAGPVYFNVIRPFHHLVVGGMARAGAQAR